MSMPEYWLAIPGEPHYEVSNTGRVRSLSRLLECNGRSNFRIKERILKPTLSSGYPAVGLGRNNTYRVHELVLLAFKGKRPNGFTASHLNGVRTDNRIENLEWESWKQNNGRQDDHGTRNWGLSGEQNHFAKLNAHQVAFIRSHSYRRGLFSMLARDYGVNESTIEDAWHRRTWRHI